MTVKELKEAIKDLPDEMEAIIQVDPEGNGYINLRGADPDAIFYDGEAYATNSTHKDNCMEYEDWEHIKSEYPRALILFP